LNCSYFKLRCSNVRVFKKNLLERYNLFRISPINDSTDFSIGEHMGKEKSLDLEQRLIDFAVGMIKLVRSIPSDPGGKYLGGQLVRSGLSPALNYGEAKSAESSADFIHKMKVALKELRETFVALKILRQSGIFQNEQALSGWINECNELISIFVKSIQTAEYNRRQRQKGIGN